MTVTVDTSALLSILLGEDDAELMAATLSMNAGDVLISAATLVEARIVASTKRGTEGTSDLDALLQAIQAEVVPLDAAQANLASAAWNRFGRGRHPAALNFGDCFSYALAKSQGAALLFKGNDFSQTDIASAL